MRIDCCVRVIFAGPISPFVPALSEKEMCYYIKLTYSRLNFTFVNGIHNNSCIGAVLLEEVWPNDALGGSWNKFSTFSWIDINNIFYLFI